MQQQKTIWCKPHSLAAGCLLTLSLLTISTSVAATARSYARDITNAIATNNVEQLKSLQGKLTVPAEKLVVQAILTEDGTAAMELYQKQLSLYPDASLDQISRSRLAAFTQAQNRATALASTTITPAPKSTPADSAAPAVATAPVTKATAPSVVAVKPVAPPLTATPSTSSTPPVVPATVAPTPQPPIVAQRPVSAKNYTLRFGSFKNQANAATLANDVNRYAQTEIVLLDELYRVQLTARYATADEARNAARAIPMQSITVSTK